MTNTAFAVNVPAALDIVGGEFEAFRIKPLTAAVGWRLNIGARGRPDGTFKLALPEAAAQGSPLPINWHQLLQRALGFDLESGLEVVAVQDEALPKPWLQALAHSPAFAVGLATCVFGLAGKMPETAGAELASAAARFLRLLHGLPADVARHEAACAVCVRGGVSLVDIGHETETAVESASPVVPLESFLMVSFADWPLAEEAGLPSTALADFWRDRESLRAQLSLEDMDLESLFGAAAPQASEYEQSVLYCAVRVKQMIQQIRQSLEAGYLDNDVLGEMMDDESDMLVDYLNYRPGRLEEARAVAAETGALGCKYTVFSGRIPAMVVFAPGKQEDVRGALEQAGFWCREAEIDPLGLSLEEGELHPGEEE